MTNLRIRLHEDSVEIAACLFNKDLLSDETPDDAAKLIEAWLTALADEQRRPSPAKEQTEE